MEAPVSIKVLGVKEAINYLKKAGRAFMPAIDKGIAQGATLLQREIQLSIFGNKAEPRSVDTGRFLSSVRRNKESEGHHTVSTNVKYAPHLEYGTRYIHPRRHFRNSADRKQKDIIKLSRKVFKEELLKKGIK